MIIYVFFRKKGHIPSQVSLTSITFSCKYCLSYRKSAKTFKMAPVRKLRDPEETDQWLKSDRTWYQSIGLHQKVSFLLRVARPCTGLFLEKNPRKFDYYIKNTAVLRNSLVTERQTKYPIRLYYTVLKIRAMRLTDNSPHPLCSVPLHLVTLSQGIENYFGKYSISITNWNGAPKIRIISMFLLIRKGAVKAQHWSNVPRKHLVIFLGSGYYFFSPWRLCSNIFFNRR